MITHFSAFKKKNQYKDLYKALCISKNIFI